MKGLNKNWEKLLVKLQSEISADLDLKGVLFLIGVQELQKGLRQAIETAKETTVKRQKFEDSYRAKVVECRSFEEKLRLANLQNVSREAALKSTKKMLSQTQKEVDEGRTQLLQWRETAMKAKDDARREERVIKETNSALMLELNEIRQNFHTFLSLSKSVAKNDMRGVMHSALGADKEFLQ